MFVCAAFSIIAVLSIIGYLVYEGHSTIITLFLHGIDDAFRGSNIFINGRALIASVDATIYISLGATGLAVLIGLPCAIYMAEFSSMRARNIAKTSLEVLDGFPSIVIGIIGYGVLSSPSTRYTFAYFLSHLTTPPDQIQGCILYAWLLLMVMSFPVIATLSEDALRAVPEELREASLGLGATRWQTTMHVLLPNAKQRIVTAVLLALAAAMGETVAILWVLKPTVPTALLNNPVLIFNPLIMAKPLTVSMETSYQSLLDSSATPPPTLYAVGFILFALVGIINIVARWTISNRNKTVVE